MNTPPTCNADLIELGKQVPQLRQENADLRAERDRLAAVVEGLQAWRRNWDNMSPMNHYRGPGGALEDLDNALAAAPPAATVLSGEPCLSQQRIDGGPWEAQCVECGHPVCEHVRRAIIDGTDGGDDEQSS